MARSRQQRTSRTFASLFGLVTAGLVLLAGCSTGEDPFGPAPGDESGQRIITGSGGGGILPPPPGVIVSASTHCLVYVSPDRGASLSTGGWSFDVPASALSRNTVMG